MDQETIQRVRDLMPTTLGSDEIRERIAADVLRRSLYSARMAYEPYLADLRDALADISAGRVSEADAVDRLTRSLADLGHSPQDGNGIMNQASRRRLALILDTNRQMASSVARIWSQTPATVDAYPAWELTRFDDRRAPRADWQKRWRAAGEAVGWEGALRTSGIYPDWGMIALKSSPIWAALGAGAGGFRDTLGNPYPPFAYGSGLDWDDVERDRCEELGLIGPGDIARVPDAPSIGPGGEVAA